MKNRKHYFAGKGYISRGIAEGHFSFQNQKENICRKSKVSNSQWDM